MAKSPHFITALFDILKTTEKHPETTKLDTETSHCLWLTWRECHLAERCSQITQLVLASATEAAILTRKKPRVYSADRHFALCLRLKTSINNRYLDVLTVYVKSDFLLEDDSLFLLGSKTEQFVLKGWRNVSFDAKKESDFKRKSNCAAFWVGRIKEVKMTEQAPLFPKYANRMGSKFSPELFRSQREREERLDLDFLQWTLLWKRIRGSGEKLWADRG